MPANVFLAINLAMVFPLLTLPALKSIGWHGVNFPGAAFAIVAIWRIGGMNREDSAAGIKKWG